MEYGKIPSIGKEASRIVFGLAGDAFWHGRGQDELLDEAVAAGINFFDTARIYGKSEQTFGKWLAERGLRDQVIILSKCVHPDLILRRSRVNAKAMRQDLEKSLQELRTDYIDIYLLHRDDPKADVGELVETFNAMHAEGKIGAFGGSNWTHRRIEEANEYAYKHSLIPFSVSSPHFGLAEMVRDAMGGCISIAGSGQADARAWYLENQMPVVAYASLSQGFLSGRIRSDQSDKAVQLLGRIAAEGFAAPVNFSRLQRCEELAERKGCSVSQLALSWVLGQGLNTFAVVSTSSLQRMQSNIAALEIELTEAEKKYLCDGGELPTESGR